MSMSVCPCVSVSLSVCLCVCLSLSVFLSVCLCAAKYSVSLLLILGYLNVCQFLGASGVSAIFGILTKPGGASGGEGSVQETGVLGEKVCVWGGVGVGHMCECVCLCLCVCESASVKMDPLPHAYTHCR